MCGANCCLPPRCENWQSSPSEYIPVNISCAPRVFFLEAVGWFACACIVLAGGERQPPSRQSTSEHHDLSEHCGISSCGSWLRSRAVVLLSFCRTSTACSAACQSTTTSRAWALVEKPRWERREDGADAGARRGPSAAAAPMLRVAVTGSSTVALFPLPSFPCFDATWPSLLPRRMQPYPRLPRMCEIQYY